MVSVGRITKCPHGWGWREELTLVFDLLPIFPAVRHSFKRFPSVTVILGGSNMFTTTSISTNNDLFGGQVLAGFGFRKRCLTADQSLPLLEHNLLKRGYETHTSLLHQRTSLQVSVSLPKRVTNQNRLYLHTYRAIGSCTTSTARTPASCTLRRASGCVLSSRRR